MSWDIFVQDIPRDVERVDQLPDNYQPRPIGLRSDLIRRIGEVAPEVDFSDTSWGRLDGDGYSIEINLGADEIVHSFALHVRGDARAAYQVHNLLQHLQLRAFDPTNDTGIFSLAEGSLEGLECWRAVRRRVIEAAE